MNAIGLFAGRGDVILSMGLALAFGIFLGWRMNAFITSIRNKFKKK